MSRSKVRTSPNSEAPDSNQKRRTEVTPPAFTHAATANQYAREVVSGIIPAGKFVRLACQRHLDDLVKSESADYPYRFDPERGNKVCRFIEKLPHTEGIWASRREPIKLEPWQCFGRCVKFGWVHKDTNFRRFKSSYECIPRKNAKSTIAAAEGLYMFAGDGEFGAEVYSGANTEKQAWEVFGPARLMTQRTPQLSQGLGITVGAKNLYINLNGSRFEPLIGSPGDGGNPHFAIVDEFHEAEDAGLFDAMNTGMGARTQPMMNIVTTAGSNLAGPCRAAQIEAEKVLEGLLDRPDLYAMIYGLDETDDWTSEAALRKANPNFDVSVFGDFLRTQQKNAIADARKQNVFKTKHLNVWCGAAMAWFNIQQWQLLADPSLRAQEFLGCQCFGGLDLSMRKDPTAYVKIFRRRQDDGEMHYYVFGDYYLPSAVVDLPENQIFQAWRDAGHLKTSQGEEIRLEQLQEHIITDVKTFRMSELVYDRQFAGQLAQNVSNKTRIVLAEMAQTRSTFNEPMHHADALIAARRIHHDGNPVLTWMMSNVMADMNYQEAAFPVKESPENKIDGAVALLMALSRATVDNSGAYTKVWVGAA